MAETITIIAGIASVTKALGGVISLLSGLQGIPQKVKIRLRDVQLYRRLLRGICHQYTECLLTLPEEDQDVVFGMLTESYEICEEYTKLLRSIAESATTRFKWTYNENKIEELRERLEASKASLMVLGTWYGNCSS